jgi:hypothetical protein
MAPSLQIQLDLTYNSRLQPDPLFPLSSSSPLFFTTRNSPNTSILLLIDFSRLLNLSTMDNYCGTCQRQFRLPEHYHQHLRDSPRHRHNHDAHNFRPADAGVRCVSCRHIFNSMHDLIRVSQINTRHQIKNSKP